MSQSGIYEEAFGCGYDTTRVREGFALWFELLSFAANEKKRGKLDDNVAQTHSHDVRVEYLFMEV